MSNLATQYTERFNVVLKPAAIELEEFVKNIFEEHPGVCRISARAKSIDSFLEKAARTDADETRYEAPLDQIQDQLGALVITRFLSDVEEVAAMAEQRFRRIEKLTHEPESNSEFGYIGRHYILFVPTEVTSRSETVEGPTFFELQIKTLFQYAWSESNHAIGYKNGELSSDQRRLSAYVAAQAWGADRAVDELNSELNQKFEMED